MSQTTEALQSPPKAGVMISDSALQHLKTMRDQQGQDLLLRVGVRQGGCSGMSYTMDFITPGDIHEKDEIYDYEGFRVVCDPKSLLYIYGMQLDYINALIGGGFQFVNPNASQTCGCGNSFSA